MITTSLIKSIHGPELRRLLCGNGGDGEGKAAGDGGGRDADGGVDCRAAAAALLNLRALRLDGQELEGMDGLEPFDNCEELYLQHNRIATIEVPHLLSFSRLWHEGVLELMLTTPRRADVFVHNPHVTSHGLIHHQSLGRLVRLRLLTLHANRLTALGPGLAHLPCLEVRPFFGRHPHAQHTHT